MSLAELLDRHSWNIEIVDADSNERGETVSFNLYKGATLVNPSEPLTLDVDSFDEFFAALEAHVFRT